MCGRSSLTKNQKELEQRFQATFYSEDLARYNPFPNYNVAPTHFMPVITNDDPIHFNLYKWGLIPFWAKEAKIGATRINARIETINEKSTYTKAYESRRCLVPLDGFYEWRKVGKEKQPYRIQTISQEVFSCAGLWEKWLGQNNETIFSFTIITLPANQFMLQIHDRMPAILLPEQEKLWLDPLTSKSQLAHILQPYPSNDMQMYRVSQKVNSVKENNASLIERVPEQGTLF